jgi:hypothetical protein
MAGHKRNSINQLQVLLAEGRSGPTDAESWRQSCAGALSGSLGTEHRLVGVVTKAHSGGMLVSPRQTKQERQADLRGSRQHLINQVCAALEGGISELNVAPRGFGGNRVFLWISKIWDESRGNCIGTVLAAIVIALFAWLWPQHESPSAKPASDSTVALPGPARPTGSISSVPATNASSSSTSKLQGTSTTSLIKIVPVQVTRPAEVSSVPKPTNPR